MTQVNIDNVTEFLTKNIDNEDNITKMVRNVVAYLLAYNVDPKYYSIHIDLKHECIFINIDEQGGYVDTQVSKSKFEFINGVSFYTSFDELPNMEECFKLDDALEKKRIEKRLKLRNKFIKLL